jgi:DNA polymerase III psi subunit
MAADPQKTADTQAWLIKARRDLLVAEQLFAHQQPLLVVIFQSYDNFSSGVACFKIPDRFRNLA